MKLSITNIQCKHKTEVTRKNQVSCETKGLAIASMPSTGHISTTEVPLHTTRPNCRVSSVNLYGSSGSMNNTEKNNTMDTVNVIWQGGHRVRQKFPKFSRLFQSQKLTFPQAIATKSNCNNSNLRKHCKFPQRSLQTLSRFREFPKHSKFVTTLFEANTNTMPTSCSEK